MTRVLLLSTYELGHQPLGLASPAASLRAAGHEVEAYDLAIEAPDLEVVRRAELIGISAPMHTAARLGVQLARRLRELAPEACIAWYGLEAAPLPEHLKAAGLVDATAGGEYEPALVEIADGLAAGSESRRNASILAFPRDAHTVPDRRGLPPLERYARVLRADGLQLAAYVEASRGCAHTCTHCPITPVYGGRLRLVRPEVVLADIDQQVAMGAAHVTFGDPDFLNAAPHSLAILEAMSARHPALTFDATVKVEHLIEHEALLPRLIELGCLFITSALESLDDEVLRRYEKGHTRDDIERVLGVAEGLGLTVRPTWVAFAPWTTLDGFAELLEFIERRGLVHHVQPVQYALRLLLPPGSPLIATVAAEGALGAFDAERLTHEWTNPDPRVDALHTRLSAIVEEAAARHDHDSAGDTLEVFARVKGATLEALGRPAHDLEVAPQPRGVVPGLTESWFC